MLTCCCFVPSSVALWLPVFLFCSCSEFHVLSLWISGRLHSAVIAQPVAVSSLPRPAHPTATHDSYHPVLFFCALFEINCLLHLLLDSVLFPDKQSQGVATKPKLDLPSQMKETLHPCQSISSFLSDHLTGLTELSHELYEGILKMS